MKVLGHIFVALEAASVRNRPLIVWGSILSEMVPYIKPNPFEWQELHEEAGEKVSGDLGVGLRAHSVAKGADRFDLFDKLEQLGYFKGKDSELEREVAESSGLSDMDIAARRIHNLLDLALDFYIVRHHPWVLEELKEAYERVSVEEIAGILAQALQKEPEAIVSVVQRLKAMIRPEDLTSVPGLARTWDRFSRLLPEGQIDIERTERVIDRCCQKVAGKEEAFLRSAVEWTRQNLK